MTFYTVVEAARRRGEVAVGSREAAAQATEQAYGVIVNPDKPRRASYARADSIIVLADS